MTVYPTACMIVPGVGVLGRQADDLFALRAIKSSAITSG